MFNILDLPPFDKARILVFGDLMLDRYWSGFTRRISPEAPVPVIKIEEHDARPGGAANVALNLAQIGCQVNLFGVVGKDQEALDLTAQLEEKNINCYFHFVPEARTINKLRVLSRNQQMLRLDFESSFSQYDDHHLMDNYRQQLTQCDLVLLSDYAKGTLQNVPQLIALAQENNLPIFIDPKGTDYSIYAGATLITPNLAEFEAVVGRCAGNENLIVAKAKALIRAHGFTAILVTLGKDGMMLVYGDERNAMHLSAHAREVFDVTGAGDTVIALLSACFAVGVDLEKSAYLANLAAGLVVRKLGTASVTVSELRDELRAELGISQGVLSESELLSIVQDAKAKGEKIVMTNGCFDILHVGHIQYLTQAKQLGHRLIVAVNTDASVKRLKGEARPLNSLEDRMELLSSLRVVDWVVSFAEDTPDRLIRAVMPDVLVKGGDYQREKIVGYETVIANGGEVIVLPFRPGYSTSATIEKMQETVT